jgi:hypothetical protein
MAYWVTGSAGPTATALTAHSAEDAAMKANELARRGVQDIRIVEERRRSTVLAEVRNAFQRTIPV